MTEEVLSGIIKMHHQKECMGKPQTSLFPPISNESLSILKSKRIKIKTIVSWAEYCPSSHTDCKGKIREILERYNNQKVPEGVFAEGVCSLVSYQKYFIYCPKCKEKLASVYSRSPILTDWRRLRYFSWFDKNGWRGCFGVNLSKDRIKLECCCSPSFRRDIAEMKIQKNG